MSTDARRRLMRDLEKLRNQDTFTGILASPCENNLLLWNAVIFGPEDVAWEGGTFYLRLEFTEDYPKKPPEVFFTSKMFHPNVYPKGNICIDMLQKNWTPVYDVFGVLTSLRSLLTDPNPDSPANPEAANLFKTNRREYNRRVREVVENSWFEPITL